MMRRVVEALGADPIQWRALSGAMLKNDLRSGTTRETLMPNAAKGVGVPWLLVVLYGLFGAVVAILTAAVPSLFPAGLFSLSMVGSFVAVAVLLDFQSAIVSPNDYGVLAHQPVSSRTYFVARLTTVLVYVGAIGALTGGPATLAYLLRFGPLVAAAWLAALAGAVAWIALAMVFVYAAVLVRVRPDRFRRVLSYVQILFTSIVFAAPLVLFELPGVTEWLGSLENGAWPMAAWLPPGWFASLLPLAAGNWTATGVLAVLTGAITTATLVRYGGRRLSLSYAERLGVLATASAAGPRRRTRPARPGPRWFSPEMRAIMALVRAQFRHDMKFRMVVLSIVPIMVFYVFVALRDGSLADPFVELSVGPDALGPIHFSVLLVTFLLVLELSRSDSHRASWVFFSAPVELSRLVTRTGLCVTLVIVLPYSAGVAAILAWAFGNAWHALGHAAVLGLVAHLESQLLLLIRPRLPFSEPPRVGGASASMFAAFLLVGMLNAVMTLFAGLAYASPLGWAAAVALLAGLAVVLPGRVARRIRRGVDDLEFGA